MLLQRFARYLTILLFVACLSCSCTEGIAQGIAQEDGTKSKQDQTKVVRAIFDSTKTAKTEKDFTAFLKQCDEALLGEMTNANREYVVSLTGWALSRRGEKRLELAKQLKKVENKQFDTVMKSALEDFDKAIMADGSRVRSWKSRGIAHVANENWDEAIRNFAEVTKIKADDSDGWFNRAEALFHRGNFDFALKDYTIALQLNSSDLQSLTGRGLCQMELRKFEKALEDFDKVINFQPETDSAHINRGDALQKLRRWNDAKVCYEKAHALKESGTACQRIAWLLATCPDEKIRNSETARTMVNRAIELNGKSPNNMDTLAATAAAAGDFDSAKTTQQELIGLVNAEESSDSPYKVRLMLYEKNEPFIQAKSPAAK